jgi:hypothetical protein
MCQREASDASTLAGRGTHIDQSTELPPNMDIVRIESLDEVSEVAFQLDIVCLGACGLSFIADGCSALTTVDGKKD